MIYSCLGNARLIALAQAASDPALKAWFDDQRRFDSGIAAAIQSIPVPADPRSRILTGGRRDLNINDL